MTDERLTRLEESQAFTERTVEMLDDEVRALGEKVDALRRVIANLESRLEAATAPIDEDDTSEAT